MPMPTERVLEMVAPEKFTAALKEPELPEDKDSDDADQLPTYNAYSADGDVTGELVYVNYGTPEDYERLAKLGVDVKGKIVIARYGTELARHQAEGGRRARRHRLPDLLRSARRRVFPGRHLSGRILSALAGRAARQRHGHADPSGRSADAGLGIGEGRQEAGSIAGEDAADDSGAADLLRRCDAAAAAAERTGRAGGLARRAADDLSHRRRARHAST